MRRFRLFLVIGWVSLGMLALAACVSTPTETSTTRIPHVTVTRSGGVDSATPSRSASPTAPVQPQAPPTSAIWLPLIGMGRPPSETATALATETLAPTLIDPSATPAPPTEPPTFTPSPTPIWPPTLDRLTNSKLGIHSLGTGDSYVMEFVRHAKPRIVKAVDDVRWLAEVKAASPGTITLGRFSGWEQDGWIANSDANVVAEAIVAQQLPQMLESPGVDYWEGWNEFVPQTVERMQWFATFEAARVCALQVHGLQGAVGGFATGVPEFNLMQHFLPALQAAQRCGGIFHLHEYNAPKMECGVSPAGVAGIIPGAPALSVPAGPLTLRYRFWYEAVLKPNGLNALPLVISETGLDAVQGCSDGPTGPWKQVRGWWIQQGLNNDEVKAYVDQLVWYDTQLRQDSYVIGATIFTAGAQNANDGWYPFDIHDVLPPLAFYAVSQ